MFGYAEFREGQLRALRALYEGRDALVIMPTGSGKSLCYQIPALVLEGVTVVVSPLIALMKDQVDALSLRMMNRPPRLGWAVRLSGVRSLLPSVSRRSRGGVPGPDRMACSQGPCGPSRSCTSRRGLG